MLLEASFIVHCCCLLSDTCLTRPFYVCVCVPASGTDKGEGDELVPERVILRYGLRAHQGLEAGVFRQVTDLASVGTHLCWLHSARLTTLHCFFTKHMPNPGAEEKLLSLAPSQR